MEVNPQFDTEVFSADAQVLPSTANAKDGTIDVVWYSGASVPRRGTTRPETRAVPRTTYGVNRKIGVVVALYTGALRTSRATS